MLGYVHTWRFFLTRKSWQECFFNEKQSWQRLLQIAAESIFCCHSNSCNSSLALCAEEMSRKSKKLALALAFEVNGKENVDSQRRLWVYDIIRGRNQYGAYNNLRSVYLPAPSPFFSCCYGNDRSRYSLVHWSAVKKALDVGRFFSEKLNSELQKKTPTVAF